MRRKFTEQPVIYNGVRSRGFSSIGFSRNRCVAHAEDEKTRGRASFSQISLLPVIEQPLVQMIPMPKKRLSLFWKDQLVGFVSDASFSDFPGFPASSPCVRFPRNSEQRWSTSIGNPTRMMVYRTGRSPRNSWIIGKSFSRTKQRGRLRHPSSTSRKASSTGDNRHASQRTPRYPS